MHTAIPDWVSLITWLFSELQTCLNSSWALCSPDLGMVGCAPAFPESPRARWCTPGTDDWPLVSWHKLGEMLGVPNWSFCVSLVALRNISASDVTPRPLGCSTDLTGFTVLVSYALCSLVSGASLHAQLGCRRTTSVYRLLEPDQKQLFTRQAS